MIAFFHQRWFLFALVAVLVAGLRWPAAMEPVVGWLPGDVIVALVTFIMALPLATGALWSAVRRPGPAWLAAGLNSGVAPLLGWIASRPLPHDLAVGVIVTTTVPCTLATAAVWTRRAGGNDAVAFLVTMITNLACFIVVPAWLRLLVGLRAEVNYGRIVLGLILAVVLPIVAAQLLRQWGPIGSWATRRKPMLSFAAQLGVLLMVLVGAVQCGAALQGVTNGSVLTPFNLMVMVAAVLGVHTALLVLGVVLARMMRMPREDWIAVAFSSSQKTLMVGVYLASAVGPLAILPMVAYHAAQLVVDTLLADWWRGRADGMPATDTL
jgi:sodium/bile acid cotransporter 7